MFSQTSEYALRVMVLLARQDGLPMTTRRIAAETRVPPGYLSKVLQELSRQGLVRSQRGLHGGSVLGRSSDKISIYEVISAVDRVPRIHSCPLDLEDHGPRLCALHRKLDDALALVETIFRDTSLRSLTGEPTPTSEANGNAINGPESPCCGIETALIDQLAAERAQRAVRK